MPLWTDTELRSVVLESGVESVGEQAFYNCQSLENISIPSSVTYIGNYAFMESKLDSVSKGLVYAGNWLVGNNDDSATSNIDRRGYRWNQQRGFDGIKRTDACRFPVYAPIYWRL